MGTRVSLFVTIRPIKMATGLVATRSRVENRLKNVSQQMDRASGYILGNINATPTSATVRRAMDASISVGGRSNYARDGSLTRGGSGRENRHSMMIPPSTETAKYNRQQDLKEIHDNFMKTYKQTDNKIKGVETEERKSKAYKMITSNAQPSYLDDREAKRQCVSEMFMDTNKFSTKTLSAINNLEGAVIRKKQEYNWRKEMEDFEKRSEFERDVRARNVTALHRHEAEEDIQVSSRKRQPVTAIETATEKAAKKQDTNPYSSNETNSAVASWRKSREAARQNVNKEPEPEKKSWRERMAERQKEEEERKAQEAAEAKAKPQQTAAPAAADISAVATAEPTAEGQTEGGELPTPEQEDTDGTKKMKSEFNAMFSGLEQEMEAGRSKLAKLRERIRRAKGAIKAADDALAEDDKARDAAKKK